MLKVLLVDDEPFILQGLQVLFDWGKEGYEPPLTATNGKEALEIIQNQKVDLVIADIQMPIMNGIELLKYIRTELALDTYFVFLSGYADFSYAQEAMRYKCTDYILKPVEKESMLATLKKVSTLKESDLLASQENRAKEKAFLDRNLMALLRGKFDQPNLDYVVEHLPLADGLCYVAIQLDVEAIEGEDSDEENRTYLRKVYDASGEFLKEYRDYCVLDVADSEKIYDIGFLFCDSLLKKLKLTPKEYLEDFLKYLKDITKLPLIMLVGKWVNGIQSISRSYGTACMLRSLQGFREKKEIYYYEEEYQVSDSGVVLCKKNLDAMISAIEQNNRPLIKQSVEEFYEEMNKSGITAEAMNLNVNYLLFQLIHLASEQDDDVNQEEILRLISESTFDEGTLRGSKMHLCRMACEYGEYLTQLRKNVSRGVLGEVEKEIKNNYASNLTLKELAEKYYVNSAYLGQLFRKKYDCSFKDYLNKYRMEEAAKLLIRTDYKIYQIAETVGYKDVDYFVNKFIAIKGCTPAKFRKQSGAGNES